MTLRDLTTMARAKQESEWARAGVVSAAASVSIFGGKFDPMKFIPPAFRGEQRAPKKSAAQIESESKLAWRMLDRFFAQSK